VTLDPLAQLVHHRQSALLEDAWRQALARSARPDAARGARLRRTTARLLHAAAARLEASGPAPAAPLGECP
jgi:hypothetical protein